MNPTSKKFMSLFLVFSLVILSMNLYAKERRGAKLIITKKDGQLIEGEIITVKPNSLLLLDTEGKDVSVDIADIKVIRIVKKSKAGKAALLGGLFGGLSGALVAVYTYEEAWTGAGVGVPILYGLILGAIGGGIGALIGALSGAIAGTDKTIQIEGMTDSEIQETIDKLRKKARIRDYK